MELTSPAFESATSIPEEYTCDGHRDLNPPLTIDDVPEGAVSLVLVMDDPDVPKQVKPDGVFDHWVVFNIPVTTTQINSGDTPGTLGANGAGKSAYTGPCPPAQYEPSTHRYFFRVYALDTTLDLPAGASKAQVLFAIEGHVLEEAELVGTYKKKQ